MHCGAHTLSVCGVVQRCQRGEVVDLLDNFLSEQGGVGELLRTLHHAVTDCLQLAACQDGLKLLGHDVECDLVVGHVGTDVFNQAGGQHLLCFGEGGVTHLVLQGGRTSVHNENKHESVSFVVFFFAPFSHFSGVRARQRVQCLTPHFCGRRARRVWWGFLFGRRDRTSGRRTQRMLEW